MGHDIKDVHIFYVSKALYFKPLTFMPMCLTAGVLARQWPVRVHDCLNWKHEAKGCVFTRGPGKEI